MHFIKLRLQGFKSFVDATEVPIPGGLTGVVGPNGCGKSNLLEAVRWVMGETSAKAMRGAGMEDVIFAGSASRPPRAFAEVGLLLDNRARRAPPGFNDADQLEVTRRIGRDLGSTYRVNGKEARARDVRMLFADASTGSHSPALVRQGRIGELVNAKPVARRAILEEAAGVSGLHQRRHEALLKLDAAGRNLERVDEVLDGLQTRLAQLSRQAKEAARYRSVAERLRAAELGLALARWREAREALSAAEAASGEAAKETARAVAAAREAEAAREAAGAAAPPAREEAMTAAAIVQRLNLERDQLDARAAQAAEAAEAAKRRLAQVAADGAREAALNADAGDTLARLDAEIAEIDRAREGAPAAIAAGEEAATAARTRLFAAETASRESSERAARARAEADALARRAAETAALAAKAASAAEAAARAHEETAAAEPRLAAAARETAERAETARAGVATAETASAAAEAARAEAQAAEAEARSDASSADAALAALRSETKAVEGLLARSKPAGAPMLDAVRVAPGYEGALAAAFGDDLGQPAVEDGRDGGGWAETGPASGEPPPDGAEPLAPHVAAPPRLARRLARVAVVPGVAQGDALQSSLKAGWRLVTRDGALWRWDGLRTRAGSTPAAAAARLSQRNRLEALRDETAEADARAEAARAAHAAARAALDATTAADAEARAGRRRADEAQAAAERAAAQAEAARDLAASRAAAGAEARDRARAEAADAAAAAREAQDALSAAEDPSTARAEADALRRAEDEARSAARAAENALDELKRRDAARARRREAAAKERAGWAARLADAERRGGELAARRDRAAAEAESAAAAPAAIAEDRRRLSDNLDAAERRRAAAADAQAAAEAALREAEARARAAETAAGAAREAAARREALREAEAARTAEAEGRLAELAPQGVGAAMETVGGDLPSVEAAEVEVAKLRRQRDAMGPVNLRAEEDASEVEEERAKLAGEKADLEEAISKLRQGVAELNREGRARLLAAFGEVDETFRGLFRHLFGGGEAQLQLVESDDPLEAGLEIMAMPPGKKLAALSLLSGGEQTLTALALIFAVFLVNPAPICVLDEVDAPLDEANVGRFCDLLDEMTRRTETRFLVITHHAVTMSRMDRLVGVTMAEQGVSQLVTVDLALAAEMAAG